MQVGVVGGGEEVRVQGQPEGLVHALGPGVRDGCDQHGTGRAGAVVAAEEHAVNGMSSRMNSAPGNAEVRDLMSQDLRAAG